MSYKLELYIEPKNVLPIGLSVACNKPEDKAELDERVKYIETAIHWLTIQKENEIRFFEHNATNR